MSTDGTGNSEMPEVSISRPMLIRQIDIDRLAATVGAGSFGTFGTGDDPAIAPPGFHHTVASALDVPRPFEDRLPDGRLVRGAGRARAMAAGTEIETIRPIRAGEQVRVEQRLASRVQKTTRIGVGEFCTWERKYIDQDDNLLIIERHSVFYTD